MSEFDEWLKKVCTDERFQKPTPEAYDLALMAWNQAYKNGVQSGIDVTIKQLELAKMISLSEFSN